MRAVIISIAISLASLPAVADEIWVTNEKDDTISVIDVTSLEVIRTIATGERPRGITFNRDYSRVYVCASDSDTVQVIDPNTGEILHNLPSGEDPEQFVLHPDDRHLYIANEDDAITTVVDVIERRVVAQIDVGIEPEGMAISPDGKIAVTTSETTNMAHWIAARDMRSLPKAAQSFGSVQKSAGPSRFWRQAISPRLRKLALRSKEYIQTVYNPLVLSSVPMRS
jgi:PQQ-dependent catabolism-associated beta-propeller protein